MPDSKTGTCRLCGRTGELSFEHIPPRAAFNKHPVLVTSGEELLKVQMDPARARRRTQQRGWGGYTLCGRCNSITGEWYGNAFVDWTYQVVRILAASNGNPGLYYNYSIFPLRVLKQVVCMFMSANAPGFGAEHPELPRFVLNQRTRYLNPRYRIFAYFGMGPYGRQSGVSVIGNVIHGRHWVVSEIGVAPVGFLLSIDTGVPERRVTDISYFAKFGYDDWRYMPLQIPTLPVQTYLPADFRSKKEVDLAVAENRRVALEAQLRRGKAGGSQPG